VSGDIKFGYSSNEIGFGWTNAAFIDLYAGLRQAARPLVLNLNAGNRETSPKLPNRAVSDYRGWRQHAY